MPITQQLLDDGGGGRNSGGDDSSIDITLATFFFFYLSNRSFVHILIVAPLFLWVTTPPSLCGSG